MKKGLLLFLALLLPVLIFLFLRSFGKNEFNVPALFMDAVSVPENCSNYSYKAPYAIEDSVLQRISWNENDSLTVIVFEAENKINLHEQNIQIERTRTAFEKEPVKIVQVFNNKLIVDLKLDINLQKVSLDQNEFQVSRNCVFLLGNSQDAVVVDSHKRIRGQYNLTKREDADRMIMQEMNILLKRY